jgi:2-oxoglutarate dehydrogenase E2 component (dihydrolipoamide succinyltransferase)
MAKYELYLPAMGEGVTEATITKWLKEVGDTVEEDEAIVEVATDKVDSEVPSQVDGVIAKLFFEEGDTPNVGDVIAIITTDGDDDKQEQEEKEERQETPDEEISTFAINTDIITTQEDSPNAFGSRTATGKFLSPLVRNIANAENVSLPELDGVKGSGKDGRITKADILKYIRNRDTGNLGVMVEKDPDRSVSAGQSLVKAHETLPSKPIAVSVSGEDEIIEMDRMRKLIADHMVQSVKTSPHVTSFVEIDVTDLVEWRNRVKNEFKKREGQNITFTPIFIEAAARAIRDFPMVNVSVDGSTVVKKKRINIGMATALPNGNLIVPVIKGADQLNIVGLAKSVNDLANRARGNKLKPDEIAGGTFTITNFGSFDNITGTPIINQPEVAILGVGAIKKKPAVVETPQGDFIAIRHIMVLALSYDHRVVDGALGGQFLRRVGDYLEKWDKNRTV